MTRSRLFSLAGLAMMSASVATADLFQASWSTTGAFADTSPVTFSGVTTAGAADEGDYKMNMLLGTIEFREDESLYSSGVFSLIVTLDDFWDGAWTFAFLPNYSVVPRHPNGNGPSDRLLIDFPDPVTLTISGLSGPTFQFGIPDVDLVRNGHRTRSFDLVGYITSENLNSTTAVVSAVPEPQSVVLLASVICGVVVLQRKRLFRT
jgi:hypothetical protein